MDYEHKLDATLASIRAMLLKKHHDYGENNLSRFGVFGILVRCSDKLARIENLLKRDSEVKDETQADTWRDLAGYAIQCLIMFFPEEQTKPDEGRSIIQICPNCGGNMVNGQDAAGHKITVCENCRWCYSVDLFCPLCGIQLPHKEENGKWHNPDNSHSLSILRAPVNE